MIRTARGLTFACCCIVIAASSTPGSDQPMGVRVVQDDAAVARRTDRLHRAWLAQVLDHDHDRARGLLDRLADDGQATPQTRSIAAAWAVEHGFLTGEPRDGWTPDTLAQRWRGSLPPAAVADLDMRLEPLQTGALRRALAASDPRAVTGERERIAVRLRSGAAPTTLRRTWSWWHELERATPPPPSRPATSAPPPPPPPSAETAEAVRALADGDPARATRLLAGGPTLLGDPLDGADPHRLLDLVAERARQLAIEAGGDSTNVGRAWSALGEALRTHADDPLPILRTLVGIPRVSVDLFEAR